MRQRYGIIGAAGYIAPTHMAAIVAAGGEIVTACDLSDSVGVLDRYAPGATFCREPLQWYRSYLGDVDVVVVCSPSHLHRMHTWQALEAGCEIICEKPLAIADDRGWDVEDASRVTPVLQMRLHPDVIDHEGCTDLATDLAITYRVVRGPWYDESWKGLSRHSGGIVANIGSHLLDLCLCLLGPVERLTDIAISRRYAEGVMHHEWGGQSRWSLEIADWGEARRVMRMDGVEIDLSSGEDLHAEMYRRYMSGRGYLPTYADAMATAELVARIRRAGGEI